MSGFWQIYAGYCPLVTVYFNNIQINKWRDFKDKRHFSTLNLGMAATEIGKVYIVSLDKSV